MLPRVLEEARTQNLCAQSTGTRIGDSKGKSKREFKCKCHKHSEFRLGMYSREGSAFEASKRGLAETRYVDMASVDLNALEIGSVLLETIREIQSSEIDSCAAVTVFALLGAKSCTSCYDLSARKVDGESFWYVNPRMAETHRILMALSETSDMSHDVSLSCCYRCTEACAYHGDCGMKLELQSSNCLSRC